ncbi:hypothetical protein LT85_1388 [Collimonas arenae]|uniref:Uncharacterized protein n=1 Tax=Collimonas arenae TaxID=279058 RepID=A0A0A1F7N7_9BURK|nr:hypothetical protein LT85_1388 [Collimonas arenae]
MRLASGKLLELCLFALDVLPAIGHAKVLAAFLSLPAT